MARQLSDIRTAVNKLVVPNHVSSTSTAVAAGSLTDTAVIPKYANGAFINRWLRDSAGTNFRITNVVASTGVISLAPSADTPASGAYEIFLIDPAIMGDVINRVARREYAKLSRAFVSEALVVDSPLPDPGFEDWDTSTTLNKWEVVTSTLARATTSPLFGSASAQLTTTAGHLHPKAEHLNNLLDLREHSVDIHMICKTSSANNARANLLYVDSSGSTVNNRTPFHTGGGAFERLEKLSVSIPDDARSVDVRLEIDTTATADFEHVWLEGGPQIRRHPLPSVIQEALTSVQIAFVEDRDDFRAYQWQDWPYFTTHKREDQPGNSLYVLEWRKQPPSQARIRIEGPGILNTLSADTDTINITNTESEYFEALAALEVLDNINLALAGVNSTQLDGIKQALFRIVRRTSMDIQGGDAGGLLNWDL